MQTATLSMKRSDGTVLQSNANDNVVLGREFSVPAHGAVVMNLNDYEAPNNYGLVTLQPAATNALVAWVTRVKGDDFVISTPVRQ